jgi:hypothetical protein
MESKIKLFNELLKNNGIDVMDLDLSCINLELMKPIAEEANFTEKDISGLLAYLQNLVQDEKLVSNGGSKTRKNRFKKHRKKNKTQRGGLTSGEAIGYIVCSTLAFLVVVCFTAQPSSSGNWGPGGYSSYSSFARRRRERENNDNN